MHRLLPPLPPRRLRLHRLSRRALPPAGQWAGAGPGASPAPRPTPPCVCRGPAPPHRLPPQGPAHSLPRQDEETQVRPRQGNVVHSRLQSETVLQHTTLVPGRQDKKFYVTFTVKSQKGQTKNITTKAHFI